MNGIVGMTAIAAANIGNEEQVKNCLKKIDLSSRHLLNLINDILDMSKIESGRLELHPEIMSLPEVMRALCNIVQPQTDAKQQSFGVYIRDIFCEKVLCDSVRFSQILLNLVGNAVKFTPPGGRISLKCYEEASARGENYVRLHIIVEDTGIGMTKEFLVKIFDAFAREDSRRVQKTEGTGLGMAITKYIVDAMQGTIDVQSEPGAGSKFHVVLDFEKAEEEAAQPISAEGFDLLILDSDAEFARCTAATAARAGLRADWAEEIASGLEKAKALKEDVEKTHVVLLSFQLAKTKEPVRALKAALEGGRYFLLLTAPEGGVLSQTAQEAGAWGLLHKPVFLSDLTIALARLSEKGERAAPSESSLQVDFGGKRILLAEDNELNREIAQELLSEYGLMIEEAEDGKICAEMFERSPVGYYSAILMDIRMPVMDGYAATRAIRAMEREDAKTVPIIAMSADAFTEDVERCLSCGMNAHTAKPIDMDALSKLLKKYLGD